MNADDKARRLLTEGRVRIVCAEEDALFAVLHDEPPETHDVRAAQKGSARLTVGTAGSPVNVRYGASRPSTWT